MPRRHERKRRFGISVPESLAEQLDKLTRTLNADRSRLVSEALREYLRDHNHYLFPHNCRGILVVVGDVDTMNLIGVLKEYQDVVYSYSHVHVDKQCVNVIVVSGSSGRLAYLHRRLCSMLNCIIRFIPLCGTAPH